MGEKEVGKGRKKQVEREKEKHLAEERRKKLKQSVYFGENTGCPFVLCLGPVQIQGKQQVGTSGSAMQSNPLIDFKILS